MKYIKKFNENNSDVENESNIIDYIKKFDIDKVKPPSGGPPIIFGGKKLKCGGSGSNKCFTF